MYRVEFLTYYKEGEYPHRYPYLPAMTDNDAAMDVTAISENPDPNVIVWEATISAATLDTWLLDSEIFITFYEAIDEPV